MPRCVRARRAARAPASAARHLAARGAVADLEPAGLERLLFVADSLQRRLPCAARSRQRRSPPPRAPLTPRRVRPRRRAGGGRCAAARPCAACFGLAGGACRAAALRLALARGRSDAACGRLAAALRFAAGAALARARRRAASAGSRPGRRRRVAPRRAPTSQNSSQTSRSSARSWLTSITRAFELVERHRQRLARGQVEVVGRLVEQQQVGALPDHASPAPGAPSRRRSACRPAVAPSRR